ncbi:hypothetical protein AAEP93_001161 [Penicillium crustosum]
MHIGKTLALFCLSPGALSYVITAYRNDDCSGESKRVNVWDNTCRDTNIFATKSIRVETYGGRHQKATFFTNNGCGAAINYRCHPHILAWPALKIYKSEIAPSEQNAKPECIGKAWDAITASRHHFKGKGFACKRRLVIDANGQTEQLPGSASRRNDAISASWSLCSAQYTPTDPLKIGSTARM